MRKSNVFGWLSSALLLCFIVFLFARIGQLRSVSFISFAKESLLAVEDEFNLLFSETDSLYTELLPLLEAGANTEELNQFLETKKGTLFADELYIVGSDETPEAKQEWLVELIEKSRIESHGENHSEGFWGGPAFDSLLGKRVAYRLITHNNSRKNIVFVYSSQKLFNKLLQTDVSRFGLPYIINDSTSFIAHPLGETRSLLQVGIDTKNDVLVRLSEQVIQDKPLDGNYRHFNNMTKQITTEILIPLDKTGWFLGFGAYDGKALESAEYQTTLRRYRIVLVFSIGIFLILLWNNIFNRGRTKHFSVFVYPVILISMLAGVISAYNYYPMQSEHHAGAAHPAGAIDFMPTHPAGAAHDNAGYLHPKWDMSRLISQNNLKAVIDGYQAESKILYGEPAKIIPTGLYFYSADFKNPYTIRVTGTLWQKFLVLGEEYPQEILDIYNFEDFDKKGVYMPRAYVNKMEQSDVTETTIGDYPARLFRWNFDIESMQKLSYSLYPFGKATIDFTFWTNDFDNNVVLVPDLEGYMQLYPTTKPGIDRRFHLKTWDIYSTYYAYVMESYLSNFGNIDIQGINQFPELVFNISIMRKFGDILIGKIIPLTVVLLLLFTILFVRDRSNGFNNIIGCSGLFFVLIIDHINLRESVAPDEIMFLEYAYFLSYVLLLFVAATSFDIFRKGEEYGIKVDSMIRKYYWTFVMGIMTLVTILRFW